MFVETKRQGEAAPAVADPNKLESLIAWLEQQPAKGTYDFVDPNNCLLCQYYRAVGVPVYSVDPGYYTIEIGKTVTLPRHFNEIANGGREPETFGAALKRAREALASQ